MSAIADTLRPLRLEGAEPEPVFTGVELYTVDPKGRLIMPPLARAVFGERVVLVPGESLLPEVGRVLLVLTVEVWEERRREQRRDYEWWHLHASLAHVTPILHERRVQLTMALRAALGFYPGLGVAVRGMDRALEILPERRWRETMRDGKAA